MGVFEGEDVGLSVGVFDGDDEGNGGPSASGGGGPSGAEGPSPEGSSKSMQRVHLHWPIDQVHTTRSHHRHSQDHSGSS
jgi:hypothetical protein